MENLPIATLIIATLTLIVTTIYVILTWRIASATKKSADISRKTLEEMKEARDQQTAPYIFIDIIVEKQDIYLFVKNAGKRIANNVKLKFEPELVASFGPINLPFIKDGIGSLPPGAEIKTFFDSGIRYFEKNKLPLNYKVKIFYSREIGSKD